MSKHYLFTMWEGGGNVAPLLGVARRLVMRTHTVTVLGDPTIQPEAERAGCRFLPWRRAPHRKTLLPEDDLLRDWETKSPFEMLRNYRDKFITDPAPRYAADTLDAIDRVHPDVLATEYTIFGASMAAEKRGVRTVGLVPNIWPMPVPGAPPFGPGFLPARSFLGAARDAFFRRLVVSIFDQALPSLNDTRGGLGLPPVTSFFEQALRADAVLVLSSATFDFSSRFVPPNVRYVGPVLDDPGWAEPWTPPWPAENGDPLVLVGFSTTFQEQGVVLRNVVKALSGLPVRALVTLGSMLPDGEVRTSGSVVVVRSAPHTDVLKHASVVVTHCGHGTTMKALAAGVPIVGMPMGRDQDDTAARVVHAGAGVRLKPKAGPPAIAQAVRRVLDDGSFRASAHRLAGAIASELARVDVARELEQIASHPRAPQPE
jgi:UDP:flavonoid glycosyltransferase YjiC (YdhE family)